MNESLVVVMTFAATVFLVIGVGAVIFERYFRRRARISERLESEWRDSMRDRAEQSPLFKDLQQMARDTALPTPDLMRRMQLWSEQSGLKASLGALGAMSVGAAAAGLVGGWTCVNAAAGLVFALAGAAMPWLYVEVRRKQRVWQLTLQLPDAFDAMSRALRVGQTTTAAFQRVAQDFQSPVRDEFAYCWEQQHLGIATDVSLRDLARRSGILEMQIFAVALIMAGVTGANLAELLSKLSGLIRTRIKLRAKVRALTGESRMQAVVLSVLPLIIFIALWFLNREYASQLLRHRTLLLGTIASVALGAVWINRIVVNVAR